MGTEVRVIQFLSDLAQAIPRLFELWQHLGGRDPFLVTIESMLEAARAKNDGDIERKHGR